MDHHKLHAVTVAGIAKKCIFPVAVSAAHILLQAARVDAAAVFQVRHVTHFNLTKISVYMQILADLGFWASLLALLPGGINELRLREFLDHQLYCDYKFDSYIAECEKSHKWHPVNLQASPWWEHWHFSEQKHTIEST